MKNFDKTSFAEFLVSHEETGKAYENMVINQPYDIAINAYRDLEEYTLTFHPFDQFYILKHKSTNEIFLGDMNMGGHGAHCRIIKVKRDDFFHQPTQLLRWYTDESRKIWKS